MTREEAIQVLNMVEAHGSLVIQAKEMAIKALEQEPVLDKIRAEISEYGSLWVEYKIEGYNDRDIEKLVENVLKQAKRQVLDVIDKYRKEG